MEEEQEKKVSAFIVDEVFLTVVEGIRSRIKAPGLDHVLIKAIQILDLVSRGKAEIVMKLENATLENIEIQNLPTQVVSDTEI